MYVFFGEFTDVQKNCLFLNFVSLCTRAKNKQRIKANYYSQINGIRNVFSLQDAECAVISDSANIGISLYGNQTEFTLNATFPIKAVVRRPEPSDGQLSN